MLPSQLPQLRGQGEGHHEVLHRQQFVLLPFQPLGSVVMLTARATAMATRVEGALVMSTTLAIQTHLATVGCAALLDGTYRMMLFLRQR
jgi:hypothetical protein